MATVGGHALPKREEDQIDLAFLKSHEFSVLLTHNEPLAALGKPPYRVESDKKEVLFETEDLVALWEHLMESGRKGISIQRYKGLGEMNAEQLLETTMDPARRTVLQVNTEDERIADDLFVTLMGTPWNRAKNLSSGTHPRCRTWTCEGKG